MWVQQDQLDLMSFQHSSVSLETGYQTELRGFPQTTQENNGITVSTEHSPSWEANSSTVSHEISHILGNPMFITVFTTAVLSTSQDKRVRFFLAINNYQYKRILTVLPWKRKK
jgi:hypothetical protein